MAYLRVFKKRAILDQWANRKPKLSTLLECFEQKEPRIQPVPKPASVFYVRNHREELQVVAAIVQITPSTVETRYAVSISKEDCAEAGIEVVSSLGDTGVSCVDKRHSDLTGSYASFIKLATVITEKIWHGENRLRTFVPHAILGELAILASAESRIDPVVRKACAEMLANEQDYVKYSNNSQSVELTGTMIDDSSRQIFSTRHLRFNAYDSAFDVLRHALIECICMR